MGRLSHQYNRLFNKNFKRSEIDRRFQQSAQSNPGQAIHWSSLFLSRRLQQLSDNQGGFQLHELHNYNVSSDMRLSRFFALME
jgi:hypothetical protein